jgi:hypothetical protein
MGVEQPKEAQHVMAFRRLAVGLAAATLVFSMQAAAPEPASAACYYGNWLYSDKTTLEPSVRIRSWVKYRLGYTCAGSLTGEYLIDSRQMWIDIFNAGDYQGYERDWTAFHVYNTDNYPVHYVDPNQGCIVARCSFYRQSTTDVSGWATNPYIYAFCRACTQTGFGNLKVWHNFRTGVIQSNVEGPNCSPGPGPC